jgi:muconate cycloisomerase
MKISQIDIFVVRLPFRFAFSHSLAARNYSDNIIVRVAVEGGNSKVVYGFGEGIPRDYVTGENLEESVNTIKSCYVPRFLERSFDSHVSLVQVLESEFLELGLAQKKQGASWCAFESAVLDAFAKAAQLTVMDVLGGARSDAQRNGIRYGAVVPFGKRNVLAAMLWFYRLYGFSTVKLKVDADFAGNMEKLKLARNILGPHVTLRIDANCAWNKEQTFKAAEQLRCFNVASIEQPMPPSSDLSDWITITKELPEQIIVDESLCTLEQAEALTKARACSGFNIRLSKVGGILAARKMATIARLANIACHLGAQVGESGILTAAGRTFAAIEPSLENYEGAANWFLLQKDITSENLTAGLGGIGKLLKAKGFGVNVQSKKLITLGRSISAIADGLKLREQIG